jgi:hypothetical protein
MGLDFSETTLASETSNGQRETTSFPPPLPPPGEGKQLWGGAELGGGCFDVALPVLAGEHRAATLTPVGCRRGEPR